MGRVLRQQVERAGLGEAALRNEALGARAAGDTARAVAAWRALLDLFPDDPALALELKRELRVDWTYPDSDARFRRAARSLGDADWIEHFSFFYTYHGAELAGIERRAAALTVRRPEDARLRVILGDAAAQRRDWGAAVAAFEAGLLLGEKRCAEKLARARMYAGIETAGWPDSGPGYALMVINLDQAAERMAEVRVRFGDAAVPLRRLSAVDGRLVTAAEAERLAGRADAPPGTLGCFMSHVAAWKALLAGTEECALVVEDDAVPLVRLPARLGGLGLPEGWEVVWVNERMAPAVDPAGVRGFEVRGLAGVVQAFLPGMTAPGGDGYLVSRAGARRLLELVAADGMAGDVDWRMVAYGMTVPEIEAIPQSVFARRQLDAVGNRRAAPLRALVLSPPLTREVGLWSDRQDVDKDAR